MKPLLTAEKLVKSYGGVRAIDGISFAIGEGRCAALLGPNGAGKTTTIRMLAGLLRPTEGRIAFTGLPERSDIRAHIGYLPQSPSFYGWMSGREYMMYAGRLCGLRAADAKRTADELLARVGLVGAGRRRIATYSGGMKQRLGLAQALVHRPKLLVLDEPVSALDPVGRREVLELLKELKRETTILFSTHVLPDAEELCDDIMIVRDGRIVVQGSLPDIRERYREPVITVRTERDEASLEWVKRRAGKAGGPVVSALPFEDGIRFAVSDLDAARRLLLREMADEGVKVARIEAGYSTLEDVFMKAVST